MTAKAAERLEECFYHAAFLFLADLEQEERYKKDRKFLNEYRRLIERSGQDLPALWESCYHNHTRTLLDQNTLQVIREYRNLGFEWKSSEGNEPQDYFGIECLHLSFLLFLLGQDPDDREGIRIRLKIHRFAEQHLKVFCKGLHEELGEAYPYFCKMAEDVQKYLDETIALSGRAEDSGQGEEIRVCVPPAETDVHVSGGTEGRSGAVGAAGWVREQLEQFRKKHPDFGMLGIQAVPAGKSVRLRKRGAGCWNNCGNSCLKEVTAENGCILKVASAKTEEPQEDRLTTCIRGLNSPQTFLTADRLRYPLLRTGKRGSGEFRRISWEEAVEWMARKNLEIRSRYGPQSRYVAYSTGVVSEVRPDKVIRRFLNLDGGFLEFYNDYSAACINYISELMYGTCDTGNSIEDLLHSHLILVWGHNPLETGFGPGMRKMLVRAKKKGIRIVAIDPRCSDTASYVNEWIPIRPGTDGAMAAAMAYVILTRKKHNPEFLHRFCMGFDRETMPEAYRGQETFEDYILGLRDGIPKTPEWAQEITGVPADTTKNLALAYAAAKPAAILQGCGPQRQANGEQTARMIAMLSCLCGYIGISGGRCGAVDAVEQYPHAKFPKGINPYPGQIPCYLWTKAVRDGAGMRPVEDGLMGVNALDTGIKMIWCLAGGTLLNQHGDINETKRILEEESLCECIVCSDLFLTPGAMYADLVLPAASCFETENITRAWQEGDFLLYNQKYTDPLFQSRYEYGWIQELAEKSGVKELFSEGHDTAEAWCQTLYERLRASVDQEGKQPFMQMPSYEALKECGIARYPEREPVIAFERQIRDPEHNPFPTPTGKIEIFSPYIYHLYREEEIAPIPKYQPCRDGYETLPDDGRHFQLIGWHTKVRTHSCHDNNRVLREKEPQAVWMHPEDASRLGIEEGETVSLENERGRTKAPVRVTARIAPGVLALTQGAWYRPDKEGTDQNGSINVLTSLRPTPLAKGNPQHTICVKVCKS